MYVDSILVSKFGETQDWRMPNPQPTGTMKRPLIVKNASSSSSLSGMEQAVPSFQDFIRRTPPVDQQKPLPPTPLFPRRASSSSPPRSRTPSSYGARRTSSVYSRTVSQWDLNGMAWQRNDFADEPLPPMPVLQPLAYSTSTPELVEKHLTPPLLQPRTYNPIITTPSPTASRVTTPSPPPQHEPSVLLPTPPVSAQVPKKHLHMVSLEKAKAAVNAPGAVHLLPEELRAQTFGRSRSHEPLRIASEYIIAGKTPPNLPEPPTLVDNQGRQRMFQSPKDSFAAASEYPFPVVDGPSPVGAENGFRKLVVPLTGQQRQISIDKAAQALGIDDDDEHRGRKRHRGPRNTDYSHYFPDNKRSTDSSLSKERPDAQKLAGEYHTVLNEQYPEPASSPPRHPTDSDDSIRAHMKMVPKPLFQTKPPAKLPGTVTRRESETSLSPHRLSGVIGSDGQSSRRSSGSRTRSFPLQLSLSPRSPHQRQSTSGSIPISSPIQVYTNSNVQKEQPVSVKQKKSPRSRRNPVDNRVSAFYPYVASRKGKKTRTKDKTSADGAPPPMPLFAADIIAQRPKTRNDSSGSLPSRKTPSTNTNGSEKFRKRSDASSSGLRQPLHQRIAKGAAKYADLLTKPSDLPETPAYKPITNGLGPSSSPHLLPSPVKTPSKQVHLGWSDSAKTTFDRIVSPVQPTKFKPDQVTFSHVAAAARPVDESKGSLKEVDPPFRRKSSIFSGMFESWKESKAERRREELKKIITVVPQEERKPPAVQRRSSTFGWM